jgi:hypothetical protein
MAITSRQLLQALNHLSHSQSSDSYGRQEQQQLKVISSNRQPQALTAAVPLCMRGSAVQQAPPLILAGGGCITESARRKQVMTSTACRKERNCCSTAASKVILKTCLNMQRFLPKQHSKPEP